MLYIYHGNDEKRVIQSSSKLFDSLKEKRSDAQSFIFHADNFNKNEIDNFLDNTGLFFDKHILVFKNFVTEGKVTGAFVFDYLDKMINSQHIIIMIENDTLDEKVMSKLGAVSESNIKEFTIKDNKVAFDSSFVFGLCSDILYAKKSRVKVSLPVWKKFDILRTQEEVPEKFFASLWWTFVQKGGAKSDLKKLLIMYHEAHMGESDLWQELEAFVMM